MVVSPLTRLIPHGMGLFFWLVKCTLTHESAKLRQKRTCNQRNYVRNRGLLNRQDYAYGSLDSIATHMDGYILEEYRFLIEQCAKGDDYHKNQTVVVGERDVTPYAVHLFSIPIYIYARMYISKRQIRVSKCF